MIRVITTWYERDVSYIHQLIYVYSYLYDGKPIVLFDYKQNVFLYISDFKVIASFKPYKK